MRTKEFAIIIRRLNNHSYQYFAVAAGEYAWLSSFPHHGGGTRRRILCAITSQKETKMENFIEHGLSTTISNN